MSDRPDRMNLPGMILPYRTDVVFAEEHLSLSERGFTGNTVWSLTHDPKVLTDRLSDIRKRGSNTTLPIGVIDPATLTNKRMRLPVVTYDGIDRRILPFTGNVPDTPILIEDAMDVACLLHLQVSEIDVVYVDNPEYVVDDYGAAIRYDMPRLIPALFCETSDVLDYPSYIPGHTPPESSRSVVAGLWSYLERVGFSPVGKRALMLNPGPGLLPHSFLQLGGASVFCIESMNNSYYLGQLIGRYYFQDSMYMWETPGRYTVLAAPGNYDFAIMRGRNVSPTTVGTMQDILVSLSTKTNVVVVLMNDPSEVIVLREAVLPAVGFYSTDTHTIECDGLKLYVCACARRTT